eukprot:CAMPEP_0203896058 /NCGR_PEP_ID=MMETSP0359-20131031/38836_1 /ASSEMBLY_ACC=CAM_ASM_000338 /TAXON_ID=268821 /ORGANISM="Scrippsiella Hangoei, Strain SHTV-5" /LENGTH=92 /DNA_ID=CAMNT_0050818647 /DNA_START=174 /DNA_END=452 /DNA_ORIENTATION=-
MPIHLEVLKRPFQGSAKLMCRPVQEDRDGSPQPLRAQEGPLQLEVRAQLFEHGRDLPDRGEGSVLLLSQQHHLGDPLAEQGVVHNAIGADDP